VGLGHDERSEECPARPVMILQTSSLKEASDFESHARGLRKLLETQDCESALALPLGGAGLGRKYLLFFFVEFALRIRFFNFWPRIQKRAIVHRFFSPSCLWNSSPILCPCHTKPRSQVSAIADNVDNVKLHRIKPISRL